jgi:hypothetical protein
MRLRVCWSVPPSDDLSKASRVLLKVSLHGTLGCLLWLGSCRYENTLHQTLLKLIKPDEELIVSNGNHRSRCKDAYTKWDEFSVR